MNKRIFNLLGLWLLPIAYMALIFFVSSFPVHIPQMSFSYRDKLAHLIEYALLVILLIRAISLTWPQKNYDYYLYAAIMISTLFGALDEIHQSFVPGRTEELLDVVADFIGSVLGALLVRKKNWH